MKLNIQLGKLPPYLFAELERKRRAAQAAGADLIHLGIGDPDSPTPDFIVERMARALRDPAHHRYPDGRGSAEFRRAAARFMKKNYGVNLDPETEILALIGSKEGLGHLPLALAGAGQKVLTPDPGYPVYANSSLLANARPVAYKLEEKNAYLPDIARLPAGARLMFLNYPHNPTGATASLEFFEKLAAWALKRGTWLAHDAAYAEAFLDGARPPSLLQVPHARLCAVEFHSLSKTFNMTGWRVGWACGNAAAVAALAQVKSNMDSGVFTAVQEAAISALDEGDGAAESMRSLQRSRRGLFTAGLEKTGWLVFKSQATFYLWCRAPGKMSGARAAARLLEDASIVATPGNGFGRAGEGHVRFALTVPEPRLKEALERLSALRW